MSIDVPTIDQIFFASDLFFEAKLLELAEEEEEFQEWYKLSGYHPDFIDAFCRLGSGGAAWQACFPSDVYGSEEACPGLRCATCFHRQVTWERLMEMMSEIMYETDPTYPQYILLLEEHRAFGRNPHFTQKPSRTKAAKESRCRKQRQAIKEGLLPNPPAYMTPRTEQKRILLRKNVEAQQQKIHDWLEAQAEAAFFATALVEVRSPDMAHFSVTPECIDEFYAHLPLQYDSQQGVEYIEIPEYELDSLPYL